MLSKHIWNIWLTTTKWNTQELQLLKINGISNPALERIKNKQKHSSCGCPGSKEMSFGDNEQIEEDGRRSRET